MILATVVVPALLAIAWLVFILRPRLDGGDVPFMLAQVIPPWMIPVPIVAAFGLWALIAGAAAWWLS